MSTSRPWADGPWALIETPSATKNINDHPAHYIANEMAHAHNAMLRGLNAIYHQAPHISTPDVPDFLFFGSSYTAWVIHHHSLKDDIMFPALQKVAGVKPGLLQPNIDQHRIFAKNLDDLHAYCIDTNAKEYSGAHIRHLIKNFAAPFRKHLADEISLLWAMDSVQADTPASDELREIYRTNENDLAKQDKFVVPPMLLGLCDGTYEGGTVWPKLPPGESYLVHWILGKKHQRAWRFLPCDAWGMPRALVGSEEKAQIDGDNSGS